MGALDLFGRPTAGSTLRQQLPLPLGWSGPRGDVTGLLIGESSRAMVEALGQPEKWSSMVGVIYGPARSGKSLFAENFARSTPGATVIDAAPEVDEQQLFHACNSALQSRRPLLLLVEGAVGDWRPSLPDLATRVAAAHDISVEQPDLDLFGALLVQRVASQHLLLSSELAHYVATRVERSYAALDAVSACLISGALATGRPYSAVYLRELLASAGVDAVLSNDNAAA